jgi:DNA replication protein DnaC
MKQKTELLLSYNLKELKLSSMVKEYPAISRHASEAGMSYENFLLSLTEIELQVRSKNRLKRYLREARFPLFKTLEDFDFESTPRLNKRLIVELSEGNYINDKRNVIFVGKSGTGKTHLSIGLGIEACRQGTRTRFITGSALANELIEAREEKKLSKAVQRYAKYGILVLDELGYVPFSKESSELLFQVLAERHERGSVIISTNLGFSDWTQIFGEATITAALLDRLTHRAYIIECDWDSYRFKDSMKHK